MALYVGLMSGTSLDGIDAVLAQIDAGAVVARAHRHAVFAPALAAELTALNIRGGSDELHRAAVAAGMLADACAALTLQLLADAACAPADVAAIGAHGQTVRHQPGDGAGSGGYTLQLLNGARLAERSGIDVICDFRSRDVAAGGQGAPLVPAFHAVRFGRRDAATAVLNIGGIANLTLLPAHGGGAVTGFDCGPGNGLMDLWCRQQRGTAYDADGAWAASGNVDAGWLTSLLASEPYFARRPPKSTGRDLFNAGWLAARLTVSHDPADVIATLAELTVRCAAAALQRHAPETSQLVVCGGGACNGHLMRRLQTLLPRMAVCRSDTVEGGGVPPDQVEALAFAWLASAFLERRAGSVASVTGARGDRVLGALYPR